jgi:hypothetical protein
MSLPSSCGSLMSLQMNATQKQFSLTGGSLKKGISYHFCLGHTDLISWKSKSNNVASRETEGIV